jgi:proline iminopeptidase
MSGQITDRGLFVDIRGAEDGTPLLFLHGGPGQGCYEFMAIQGDRLSAAVRLIGLDQRGVDRSAPLAAGSSLTIADLVDDCEAVREALGISRWTVLGQSFGGMLALRYAATHPGRVRAVIFENPAWDVALTVRGALPGVARTLEAAGDTTAARAARLAADSDDPVEELWDAYMAALGALGEAADTYFIPDPATRQLLQEVRTARPDSGSAGDEPNPGPSRLHHQAIVADSTFYQSLLPLLGELDMPALLITGGLDPTTSPEQREAFRRSSPGHTALDFATAGHFVHADQPADYAQAVTRFAAALQAG